ncbi:MAG: hypothetical protein QGH29_08495 [Kiritimatiellia bacterium]|nr:hypothetical protein [Kiritimatiellia bacterium]MDP6810251.1 hypothetical protein [Kiritimatiellia bacterium]
MRSRSAAAQAIFAITLLLCFAGVGRAASAGEARFVEKDASDMAVANTEVSAGTVGFDLSWSGSWRAKWTEPAERSATGKPLTLENWDAAWVFVKYLPHADATGNNWRHATLATDATAHTMPNGATCSVGRSDDGERGIGVFVYRDAVGQGKNDFKGIKLRWDHAADGVDPAKADIQVFALPMVYVPESPFKIGQAFTLAINPYPDGPKRPLVGAPMGLTEGQRGKEWEGNESASHPLWPKHCFGRLTDGAWRGGPMIPYLVDAAWSGPVAEGTTARRIAPRPGHLWWNMVWDYHNRSYRHGISSLAPVTPDYPPATFHNLYPTGYGAFYVMKYNVSQGQCVAYLNTLPPDLAAKHAFVSGDGGVPTSWFTTAKVVVKKVKVDPGNGRKPYIVEEYDGHTITSSADRPESEGPVGFGEDDANEFGGGDEAGLPTYKARLPNAPCGYSGKADAQSFMQWAGLRPMTTMESTKVGRGPLDPRPKQAGKHEPTAADLARRKAGANYWGGKMKNPVVIGLTHPSTRYFQGSHGDGTVPAGNPGSVIERAGWQGTDSTFENVPVDWPKIHREEFGPSPRLPFKYMGGVRTAPEAHQPRKDALKPYVASPEPTNSDALADRMPVDADTVKVSNFKWVPGDQTHSFVSFDVSWRNSWHAKWTEPAKQTVSGKPMELTSWDAVWVFFKIKVPGVKGDKHVSLSADASLHSVPKGAALDIGLSNDDTRGIGVFLSRDTVGSGANIFKGVKLRWEHARDLSAKFKGDPGKVKLTPYAIEMVYVAEGPFKTKSPLMRPYVDKWVKVLEKHPFPLPVVAITTPNSTQAGGYFPDSGEYVPKTAAWPNGYNAYYCMKRSITQGQFVNFLNSTEGVGFGKQHWNGTISHNSPRPRDSKLHYGNGYGLSGYTIRRKEDGSYQADVPGRHCNLISWPDITDFSAWAGLRPPTSLEYMKAARGPRRFVKEEDAWREGICAPAAGLPPVAVRGASYWGIRGLSTSGSCHEWPGTVANGVKDAGLAFDGRHGEGTGERIWPSSVSSGFGDWFYQAWEANGSTHGFTQIGFWVFPEEITRATRQIELLDGDRTGRYGARAVRTAPVRKDADAMLQVELIPNLLGYDLCIFELAGTLKNDGKAQQVKVVTPLPDTCFPNGTSVSLAGKKVTPFRILAVVGIADADKALGGAKRMSVQIQGADGKMLSKSSVAFQMTSPKNVRPQGVNSVDGGRPVIKVLNATDRDQELKVDLLPINGVAISEGYRTVTLKAGAKQALNFAIPRQPLTVSGWKPLAYHATVGAGAAHETTLTLDLQPASRWWVKMGGGGGQKKTISLDDMDNMGMDLGLGLGDDLLGGTVMKDEALAVFKQQRCPAGWNVQVDGASSVNMGKIGAMKSAGATVMATTRVESPSDQSLRLDLSYRAAPGTTASAVNTMVLINGQVIYDTANPKLKTLRGIPVKLKKGKNSLAILCSATKDRATTAGQMTLKFVDGRTRKTINGLTLDMGGK